MASPVWALWVYGIIDGLLQGEPLTASGVVDGVVMGALLGGLFGLFGAAAGLVAVLQHERSWLVWLAMVPVLLFIPVVIFVALV